MHDLDDLADEMAGLFGAPCAIEDPDFNLVAYSGQSRVDAVRQASILERRASRDVREWFRTQGVLDSLDPLRTPAALELGIEARLCIPARHVGRLQALFWLLDPAETFDSDTWTTAQRLADTAALLLSYHNRRRTRLLNFYRDLVSGDPRSSMSAAREIANAVGQPLTASVTCVLVAYDVPRVPRSPLPQAGPNMWFEDSVDVDAVLVPGPLPGVGDDVPQLLERLGSPRTHRRAAETARVGVGPTVSSLRYVGRSRWGAATALRGTEYGGSPARWDDMGALRLLSVADDETLALVVRTPGIDALLDRGPGSVVETARVFLDEAGSVARTAERLGVHRQTIYQRLAQAEELSGLRLAAGKDRLLLHLALTLLDHVGESEEHR